MSEPTVVERQAIEVQFVGSSDGIDEIRRAWEELESVVDPHGRHFYGAYYPDEKEYRACVELRAGDSPFPGLATATLPGGRYLRARLSGEPPSVYDRIRPTFEELLQRAEPDPRRPSLERYRRRDEIDLLLPIV
jgi:hypothetical protein